MLQDAGSGVISAFRSGSFAANRDTFEALRRNGINLDSSLNICHAVSGPDLRFDYPFDAAFSIQGVTTLPVAIFRDGFGRGRPAQVGACSFAELRDALQNASSAGAVNFVVVSHNFEMLKPGSSAPDWIVVKRFESLCSFLAKYRNQFNVRGFSTDLQPLAGSDLSRVVRPRATWLSTSKRYLEQIVRRVY